jgi:glycosyltransferase involved in cell wall biosynthesis
MFNICYSKFGDIGHVKRMMSVYRKHSEGAWAGKPPLESAKLLHSYIDEYNRFLNYDLDVEFSIRQKWLAAGWPDEFYKRAWDIAIIDDVFPHPLSAFRVQEFESYLEEFDRIKIYTSGLSVSVLGKETREELVVEFKRRRPEYARQLEVLEADTVINARLIYMVFLGNAYSNIERIEDLGTPFVFTLYPGGQFGLNNATSDMMLKRVTSSPCFRKVIVTQQVTYDYLMEKEFCAPDQVEFVFGLVTPTSGIEGDQAYKKHFGIDKTVLDVCFVGYKYVARGIDKGYDVFVDAARDLCRRYDDIQFHVVGGFDENEIDVTDIRERFTFYGPRDIEWFNEFYRDKDIILSPNVPSMIFEGSFDGFPTGACVDAALRKTAIFAADELHLNTHFVDGMDIVIIPHDAARVAGIIESYYRDPEGLKMVAENGFRKVKQLYSHDAQMARRLSTLREQVERARSRPPRRAGPFFAATALKTSVMLWGKCPQWLQDRIGNAVKGIRSHEPLFGVIKRSCPRSVIRFYRKCRASVARP